MPTPEEILANNCRIYGDICESSVSDVYDAMNMYAQQEAIEFAEWMMGNAIVIREGFYLVSDYNKRGGLSQLRSASELYQLFKQQKS